MNIKGFDKDLCCRGMQFDIGEEYRINNGEKGLQLWQTPPERFL